MRRRRAVQLIGESLGVDWRELNRGRGMREELVARKVKVDAERELLDPLDIERARCVGRRQVEVIRYVAGQVIRVCLPMWRRRVRCHFLT